MISFLNYLVEATVSLLLVLAFYKLFLSKETNFSLLRYFLLAGIILSITLPFFHFTFEQPKAITPELNSPTVWIPSMPEATQIQLPENTGVNYTALFSWIYLTGAAVFLVVFAMRVIHLIRITRSATIHVAERFKTVESDSFSGAFSFFHYIFIGGNTPISEEERKQIIEHELIHAQQRHSFDILLLNALSILFWFNPFILVYKKIFIQLHEFEADARAVQNHNVNTYCSLLARVALQSVGFSLANHFNSSLTLKRINMMQTLKQKVKLWKVASAVTILPILIFVVACHDQLEEVTELAKNSVTVSDYPKQVQTALEKLQKENPSMQYVVIEPNQDYLDKQNKLDKNKLEKDIRFESAKSITVLKDIVDDRGVNHPYYIIAEYDELVEKIVEESKSEGGVYSIVEDAPGPVGGMDAMWEMVRKNLDQSKAVNVSGTAYVMFVVNEDGSLSDFRIIKGISEMADKEALRVAQLLPRWNPGRQHGKAVKTNFVLPIAFGTKEELARLREKMKSLEAVEVEIPNQKFKVTYISADSNGEIEVHGKVTREDGSPLPGANVVVKGGTKGTTTDSDGKFSLLVKDKSTKLAVSFVGFETKVLSLQ